jgi:NAD+ synthase
MLDLNLELAERVIVAFIRDAVTKHGFKKGILGVSGGIDSAVVLALTVRALGEDNTFGLLMPYTLSSQESLTHGELVCRELGVEYETVDITPSVSAYFDRFPTEDKVLIGNKCARERMSVLYDFSARRRAMVVGTSNKSELLIGYSTLYGDSAAAFFPIGDLYKTQVFELARRLGIPDEIVEKPPSADLWKNQTDEGEIGMTYQKLDEILFQMVDLRKGTDDIEKMGYDKKAVASVRAKIVGSQFKRTMPPIAKMQHRTIGIDFRYLRDWDK